MYSSGFLSRSKNKYIRIKKYMIRSGAPVKSRIVIDSNDDDDNVNYFFNVSKYFRQLY